MSKKNSNRSDEILNELYDSLNIPASPETPGKKSHIGSSIKRSHRHIEDDKNGCEDSADDDLSSICSTDQEIDKILEESIDIPEKNFKVDHESIDSNELKKNKKRKKNRESSSKKKKKKKSHKHKNSSDSGDSSHKRSKRSRSHSHSVDDEIKKKEDKKLLKSLSRSRSRSTSRTSKKRSRSNRSLSRPRNYYSHSRSPSISKKNGSYRTKKQRTSSSISLSPPPRRYHRRTKSKSRSPSPVLKDIKDPLDAWRTAKLASLKKNSIKSDLATIKTNSPSCEEEKKEQVVIESIPLPVQISASDLKEAIPIPDLIPLPCKDSENPQAPDLDLQSIPVPSLEEGSNLTEGMNLDNSSQKNIEPATKNEKVKDEGKNKMIVIKSLKDSLVFQQAEEAQKKVKTEEDDNHDLLLEKNGKKDNTNSNLITDESGNKDVVKLHANKEDTQDTEAKEVALNNLAVNKDLKDKTSEKEVEQGKADKDEQGTKQDKKSNDKSNKKSKKDKDSHSEKKSKHRGRSRSKSRPRSSSRSKRRSRSRSRRKSRSRSKRRSRSRSRKSSKSKRRSRSRSRTRKRSRSAGRSKTHRRSRSKSRGRRKRSRSKDRHKSHSRSESKMSAKSAKIHSSFKRDESPDCVDSLRDKATRKRLLEVARRNAMTHMKSSSVPQAIENETFSTAGKSVAELTNFCQQLVAKDYSDTELSDPSLSPDESHDPEYGKAFSAGRHPFAVKDSKPILMNIRNAPMLPVKTNAERLADTSKLREQFPVSSGSQHRTVAEIGWVPVEKDETKTKEEPTVFPEETSISRDISQLVSTRLSAMRKLQDNPTDREAMTALNSAQKEMQNWALSKQKPGQFTGSTGARILSQEELSSGFQVWARKDQFKEANPVSSHFGLKMLQKMGWNPGEGLGKNKEGQVEPLVLDFKMDKKGLIAAEEMTSRKIPIPLAKSLAGKHPVSALVEICSKRKWNPPEFEVVFDSGPDHKKNFLLKVRPGESKFLMQVHVNNQTYKPAIAASTKKIAKANAAAACLQALGLIPKTPAPVPKETLNTTAKSAGNLCTTSIPQPSGQQMPQPPGQQGMMPTGQPQAMNAGSIPPPPGQPFTTSMAQSLAQAQRTNQKPQTNFIPSNLPPVPGESSNPPLPAEGNMTSQKVPNPSEGPGTSNSGGQPVSYPTPMGGMYGGNPYGGNQHYNQMHYFGGGGRPHY